MMLVLLNCGIQSIYNIQYVVCDFDNNQNFNILIRNKTSLVNERESQREAIIRKSPIHNFASNLNAHYVSRKDYVRFNNESELINLANSRGAT